MNDLLPQVGSSPGFISVTNPFHGTEVGTVEDVPPEAAQILMRTAMEGARVGCEVVRFP
jgi:hypothetical protein